MEAKQKASAMKEEIKSKLAAKMAQDSAKLAELKNKVAEKMVETKVKIDDVKEKIQSKIVAGVAMAIAIGNDLVHAKTAKIDKVVDKVHEIKEDIHQHKEAKNNKIVFVPLKSFSLSSRNVKSSATPVLMEPLGKTGSNLTASSSSVSHW